MDPPAEQDPGLPTQSIWDIPFEDLQFKEAIGKGSFGSVFKGVYLGVDVAIKKIEKADDPEYLKYIDREVSMLQSIRHPFIVQFSGICVHTSGLYIITEYVSGGDVRRLLKKEPGLSWKRKLRIVLDLAKAMLFLHSKKIIHRDLKSKNILLDEHNRIRLCDFGFARMTENNKRAKHMTMCGTEGWVAPEILLGMSYDTSCDVFSFGVVMAELITGKKPGVDLWVRTPENCFDINPDELRTKSVPNCPTRLLELCNECCQYEPLLRPKFEEVLAVLNSIDSKLEDAPDRRTANASMGSTRKSLHGSHGSPTTQHSPIPLSPPSSSDRDSPSKSGSTWKMASYRGPTRNSKPPAVNMHLAKMVERATTDIYYDISYIHDLLLAYRCFATPQNLFDLMVSRHQQAPPETLSPAELEAWNKSQKVVQLRVLIFLKRWIDAYPLDFNEEGMDGKLAIFDKNVMASSLSAVHKGDDDNVRLSVLLHRKRNPAPARTSNAMPMYPQPWFPTGNLDSLDFADVQPLEMARQISLIQSQLFIDIKPREYLQYCAERAGEKVTWVDGDPRDPVAPNLHAMEKWSRTLSRIVSSEIVRHADKAKRASVLERFIEIAEKCVSLKNFDGAFSIMEGVRNPSIERLSDTFKCLSSATAKTLESLKLLSSKDSDGKTYREALAASSPPCLPHFGSVLEEVWFLECSSPKVLPGGIVNFFHYRQLARKVFTYQQCLPAPYMFRAVQPLVKLLSRPAEELLDDEQLKRKSHQREEPSYF